MVMTASVSSNRESPKSIIWAIESEGHKSTKKINENAKGAPARCAVFEYNMHYDTSKEITTRSQRWEQLYPNATCASILQYMKRSAKGLSSSLNEPTNTKRHEAIEVLVDWLRHHQPSTTLETRPQ